jgi:hypothetical protein
MGEYGDIRREERNHLIKIIIFTLLALIFILGMVLGIYVYYSNHPCLEYKTYCYYTDTDVGVGAGIGINGQIGTVVVPQSTEIYIDCNNKGVVPNKVEEENRCIKR